MPPWAALRDAAACRCLHGQRRAWTLPDVTEDGFYFTRARGLVGFEVGKKPLTSSRHLEADQASITTDCRGRFTLWDYQKYM